MLSIDELRDGRVFVLKLRDAAGADSFWVETLYGDTAKRWYEIYRSSDWPALRSTAMDVFHNRVGDRAAGQAQRGNRCVVINTARVTVEQLSPAHAV